ncbi:hypothetical protein OG809_33675 [Kribbella soli]
MEVLFERVAGLDVGKASVTVLRAHSGEAAGEPVLADADVQDHDRVAAGDARFGWSTTR